jgi:hypothetical protein
MQVYDAMVTEFEIRKGRNEGFCGLFKITLNRQIPSPENAGVAVTMAGGLRSEVVVSVALRLVPIKFREQGFGCPRQRLGRLEAHGLSC